MGIALDGRDGWIVLRGAGIAGGALLIEECDELVLLGVERRRPLTGLSLAVAIGHGRTAIGWWFGEGAKGVQSDSRRTSGKALIQHGFSGVVFPLVGGTVAGAKGRGTVAGLIRRRIETARVGIAVWMDNAVVKG